MRYMTELMDKIFSDSTPDSFKEAVAEKIEEAKTNGQAELKDGDNHLNFAEVNGEVAIEDKKNNNEITIAKDGADGPELEAVVKDKVQSATQPDVEVPGNQDGKKNILPAGSTENDVQVSIETGITDPEKAGVGKHFSLCFHGFESEEEAQAFFSELVESNENTLNFSDEELANVAYSATEAQSTYERLMGTNDLQLAYSLVDEAEFLKAYSVIASEAGHDLSEVYEAACAYSEYAENMINQIFSEMTVDEFFSEMTEDEVNEFFSELDEVTADILFSALEEQDDTITFSEVDEIANKVYSDMELDVPVNSVFSDVDEDEVNEIFSQLSNSEFNVVLSTLEENPNATFSELNEALDEINVPLVSMFSELTEDEVKEFSEIYSEDELSVLYSMIEDEDANYIFSDFLDYVIDNRSFSEEDLKGLTDNANNLAKAVEDMKGSEDMELAKKVKVLADETLEDVERAEAAGHDVKDVKEMCTQYSEEAAKILDKEVKPTEAPTEVPTEAPTEAPTEQPKEGQKEQSKKFSEVYMGENSGENIRFKKVQPTAKEESGQRVFSDTKANKATTINPCLTSAIN